MEIGKPTTKTDFDNIRWYLTHKNVSIFVDHDRKWHIEFRTPCENLTKNKKCLMYEYRPRICRKHGNKEKECEYFDSPYLLYISSTIDFEKYLQSKGIEWRFRNEPRNK